MLRSKRSNAQTTGLGIVFKILTLIPCCTDGAYIERERERERERDWITKIVLKIQ